MRKQLADPEPGTIQALATALGVPIPGWAASLVAGTARERYRGKATAEVPSDDGPMTVEEQLRALLHRGGERVLVKVLRAAAKDATVRVQAPGAREAMIAFLRTARVLFEANGWPLPELDRLIADAEQNRLAT